MGFSSAETRDCWVTVSSPEGDEGKTFLNRFIPPEEDILRAYKFRGFELKALVRGEIPGLPGDENMYFVFEKVAENIFAQRLREIRDLPARQDQTEPSLSGQSADDQ